MPQGVTEGKWQVQGFEQITGLSTAKGITDAGILAAQFIVIVPTAQIVRYRDDGTDPTATVGISLAVGVPFIYAGDLSAIKFFEAAASGVLDIVGYS